MKKTLKTAIALFAIFCILFSAAALAEPVPLPDSNTRKREMNLYGFTWYSDYNTTLKAAEKSGYVNENESSRDYFKADSALTPHWKVGFYSGAGIEKGCGGYMTFYSNLPKVAGYNLKSLRLYMMWNDRKGPAANYKSKNACQLYMGKYEFDVTDKEGCYKDLVEKLKTIYGKRPTSGEQYDSKYTVWVNESKGAIVLSHDKYSVTLVYMAPGAEDKLVKVEQLVKQKEIDDAAGDTSGL